MRSKNRSSELVTSSHADSEEEQEQSVDDSEEDWKPEKVCTRRRIDFPRKTQKFHHLNAEQTN